MANVMWTVQVAIASLLLLAGGLQLTFGAENAASDWFLMTFGVLQMIAAAGIVVLYTKLVVRA